MKSLTESPALLTVHESSPGNYILRVSSTENRGLITGVTRLLEDAKSLVVVTPNDIKLFHSNGRESQVIHETVEDQVPDVDQMEAIAREEARSAPGEVQDVDLPQGAQVVCETAQGTKVVRRRKSPGPAVSTPETCGRCQGQGRIQMLLDGGASGDAACPVCQGKGSIPRFGGRR